VCLNQPAGIFREERAARRGLPCRRSGGIRGQGGPDLGEGIADLQDLTDWEQLPEKAARLGFDLEAGLAGHQHCDGCAGRNRGAIRDTPLDQAGAIIATVTPEQANLPTPCDEYDVNKLIGHMQAVVRRVGVVLSGQPFWSVPRELETSDWVADWNAGRAATDAVLADDACLTREVTAHAAPRLTHGSRVRM